MNSSPSKRSPVEWKKFRAEKRATEIAQIWIRFAEAMREDGLKLGEYAGIDRFEAFLWDLSQRSRRQVEHLEEAIREEQQGATV